MRTLLILLQLFASYISFFKSDHILFLKSISWSTNQYLYVLEQYNIVMGANGESHDMVSLVQQVEWE